MQSLIEDEREDRSKSEKYSETIVQRYNVHHKHSERFSNNFSLHSLFLPIVNYSHGCC